jgi:hypothetical protein
MAPLYADVEGAGTTSGSGLQAGSAVPLAAVFRLGGMGGAGAPPSGALSRSESAALWAQQGLNL